MKKKATPKSKPNLRVIDFTKAKREKNKEPEVIGGFVVFGEQFYIVDDDGYYKIAKDCENCDCDSLATLEIENCKIPVESIPFQPFMHFAVDFIMGMIMAEVNEKE